MPLKRGKGDQFCHLNCRTVSVIVIMLCTFSRRNQAEAPFLPVLAFSYLLARRLLCYLSAIKFTAYIGHDVHIRKEKNYA
jgi:hypothetical protein